MSFWFCFGFSFFRQQFPPLSTSPPLPLPLTVVELSPFHRSTGVIYRPIRHPGPVRLSCLILLSIAKDRDLTGNRHKGIDGKWWTVLALYLSHDRHYFKTLNALAGSLPALKGKKQSFLEEYGSEKFLPSNSWIYLAQRIVTALNIITTATYVYNIIWIMFSSWLFIAAVICCQRAWDTLKQRQYKMQ